MSIILGIDPGSLITGYGVIRQVGRQLTYLGSGCIRTKVDDLPSRLKLIYAGVSEIITQFQPDYFAIEQVFMAKNADSALKLGQARGVAIVAAVNQDLPVFEYAARQVKQTVVGIGSAEKSQVQHMVRTLLKLPANPQADAADALLVNDRQYSLDMKRIWSDYGRLEELALLVRRGEFDRIENPRELAELYNGEYLESEDYRWMVGRKEYVGQMFMQAAENTAKWEKSRKHYDTAIAILQKMLEVNSYSAGALRLLLKCRMESGDLNGAKRQYEKMRQIWKREWDQELGHDFTDFITMSEEEEL